MTDTTTTTTAPGEQSPGAPQITASDAAILRADILHFANSGAITREEANADLQRLGLDLLPVADANANASNETLQLDALDPPAATPGAYRIPRIADEPTPEMTKAAVNWANALHDAQLPAAIGSSLAAQVQRTSHTYTKMSPAEREAFTTKGREALAKQFGDAAPQKIAAARQLVRELDAKRGGIVDLLEHTGAGSDPLVVSMLADAAERLAARRCTSP